MQSVRWRSWFIAVSLLVGLVVAGCGSSNDSTGAGGGDGGHAQGSGGRGQGGGGSADGLEIVTTHLPEGSIASPYATTLAASGGDKPYSWTIKQGSLPAGLALATSGAITGKPAALGTSSFTVEVTDASSPKLTATRLLSITITKIWYVRPDGGSRYSAAVTTGQCDGKSDTAYSGSGKNQHCAFNDVRYLWADGTYGNSAWVIAGGDTVVIRGCAAAADQQNSDAPHCRIGWDTDSGSGSLGLCNGVNAFWGCSMPPPPSGTATQHTRILGQCALTDTCHSGDSTINANLTQLFGGFSVGAVIYLNGSQYVDLEGLEITSHNGKCTRVGAPAYPKGCSTDVPVDDFANWGIITTNTTSNISLQDLYIHGLTTVGIGGPIGGPFTLSRVAINFNAFAGWNFDDGVPTPDAPGSSITQSYLKMEGNGCLEEYPIVHSQFPALSCWDSDSGGFGDSWSGQDTELDSFSCDHCTISYNTKDAALGPHTVLKNLRITNSAMFGNMGQQGKWGMNSNSTSLFENNLIVGNCDRMSEKLPGAAQNFAQSTGLDGSYLGLFCRAAGDMFDFFSGPNSNVQIVGNSFVGYNPTFLDLGCSPANSCASSPYHFTDNIFLGYATSTSYYPNTGEAPGLFYLADSSVVVASSYNVEYGVRNGDCPNGMATGTGNVCSDPLFVNEPGPDAWPPESALDQFDFHPRNASPAVGAGKPVSGLTDDHYGVTRPAHPTIGAVEP